MDEYWEMCGPVFGDASGKAQIQVKVDIQSSKASPIGIVVYSYFLEVNHKIGFLTPKSAVVQLAFPAFTYIVERVLLS